ncbi:MAG: hypothetical protein ACRDST_18280 [Pseudonocardiaceae bacterium]
MENDYVLTPDRERLRGPRWPTAIVLICYAALALFLTWSWWTPLGMRITAINSHDMTLFSWLLNWTPHSLFNGHFPLFSDKLNAPTGINLMWNNGMALPGLLFAPVTGLFGGLATVTVLTTLGLAGSAASAYWCLRSVSVQVLPAALGGVLFGFSPAMMAQALGHPNLVFNVLAPVLILLAMRIMISENPPLKLAVLLGVTAGAQVLIGEEVLFDTGVVVVLFLLVLAISYPRLALRRARLFAGRALVALGAFLLIAGAPLGYQLLGPLQQEGSPFITAYYSADLAGYVVPTQLQVFAWDSAIEQTKSFAGGLEEHTAYLGWPLIVLCLLVLVLRWRNARVRIPLQVALVVAVLALGEELTILGEKPGVSLPWKLITELPGFEHVITTRFALFTAGLIGAALAFALDDAFDHPAVVRVAGLAAVTIAFIPLIPAPLPGRDAPRVPAFFANRATEDLACPGGSALILPFPRAESTDAMLWQQAAGMSFAMPGGYFIGPGSDRHAYVGGEPSKTGSLFHDIMADGQPRPVTSEMRSDFVADLNRWKTCTVVLGPARNFDVLRRQTTELIGKEPESVDGVLLWRDLSGVPPK